MCRNNLNIFINFEEEDELPLPEETEPEQQANENLFTDLWRRDFNGLENVIETYKRTENPRRLQCANLYYHFYSLTE